MSKDKEIEIQVRVENVKPLMNHLKNKAKFLNKNRQIDQYFSAPHRNFIDKKPVEEWLRLRDEEGKHSITYKYWHYDKNGKSNFCDEYETVVEDIEKIGLILSALNFKALIKVDKNRESYKFQDYIVSIDNINGLGDFVEIEYCGEDEDEPQIITDKMVEFLKSLNVGKIHRNFVGYPFMMLFPDEVDFFEL